MNTWVAFAMGEANRVNEDDKGGPPMSMTREEAIERLEWYQCHAETKEDADAFDMAIAALRPVSREQVEKVWTAEWTVDEFGHKCSKCGEYLPDGEDVRKPQFCPECGRAMTDEAVEMVMERLEALYENT